MTAYEMRISDWSSDVCSSDLVIFEQRFGDAEKAATRRLFLRLVTPGEGAGDTRRVVERAEIETDSSPLVMARVVEPLTEARLQIGRASCRAGGCEYV